MRASIGIQPEFSVNWTARRALVGDGQIKTGEANK
jgi:hypothetical protein